MADWRTCKHNIIEVYMYKRGIRHVECASCSSHMTQDLLNGKVFTANFKTGFWVRNRPMEKFDKKKIKVIRKKA